MEEHKLFQCRDCQYFDTTSCAFPKQCSEGAQACEFLKLKEEICIREQDEELGVERYQGEDPEFSDQVGWICPVCSRGQSPKSYYCMCRGAIPNDQS